jgi:RsiW-degrading membrane proteinase PrsW (M82 family)
MTLVIFVALLIATLIPIAVLVAVRKVDKYQTGAFRFVLGSFIWGVLAYFMAAQINPRLVDLGIADYNSLVRFYAPIIEEILKVIIILILIRRADFTYFVDGAVFGFAAGIGFAVVENYEYVLASPNAAVLQAVARVISTNLMHATATGSLGIALGLARTERFGKKMRLALSGLIVAISIHMAYNNLVSRVNSGLLLLYAAIAGIGGALFIASVIKRGFRREQAQMLESLKNVGGITAQEASAVKQVDQMKKFLAPVVEKFGSEKAQQAEKFIRLQAKLGILTKSAASFAESGNEKMSLSTEKQIETLREEMNAIRRQVGTYCMLYLRGTFLQESTPLWSHLQSIIEERAKAPRNPNAPSLWGNLDTKIKTE